MGQSKPVLAVVPMSGINLDWGISGLVWAAIQVGPVSGGKVSFGRSQSPWLLVRQPQVTGGLWEDVFGLPQRTGYMATCVMCDDRN